MINVAIFASGEGSNAENLFRYFANDPRIRFKLVLTNQPEAGIVKKAEQYKKNLQLLSRDSLEKYAERLVEFLKVEQIDLIVLAGFLLKIPPVFIKAFPDRIINIHPSLLPKYGGKGMYGKRVHEAVLANREKESGATVHLVNEIYDQGKILLQARCAVNPNDTADDLSARVRALEFDILPRAIALFLEPKA